VTSWTGSDPLVTGVGGTQLHVDAHGRPAAPTAWNDTADRAAGEFAQGNAGPDPLAGGGGRSVVFTRPGYQDGVKNVTGAGRGVPDISMSAACTGAVNVYQSFRGQPAGWYALCGTSEAAPMFAGIVALAVEAIVAMQQASRTNNEPIDRRDVIQDPRPWERRSPHGCARIDPTQGRRLKFRVKRRVQTFG
jgi:subtilase family serine protease